MHRPCLGLLVKGKGPEEMRNKDVTDVWMEVTSQGDNQVSLGQLIANVRWVQSCWHLRSKDPSDN